MSQNNWNSDFPNADGETLIGNTSTGRPDANTFTAGTNVTITNSANGVRLETSPISDWVVIQRDTVSSPVANIDYVCRLSDFRALYFFGDNFLPSASAGIGFSVSTNGGVSFDTTASNYHGTGFVVSSGGSTTALDDTAIPGGKLQGGGNTLFPFGTSANQIVSLRTVIWNPSNTQYTKAVSHNYYEDSSSDNILEFWGSFHRSTTAVNALRLRCTTGNIAQGTFVLYGAKK